MKIISKVHDYYDSVASLGVSDVYFIRKPEVLIEIHPLSNILHKTRCWGESPGILFFCGQVFPLICLKRGSYKAETFLINKNKDFERYELLDNSDRYAPSWPDLYSRHNDHNTYYKQGFNQFIQDCSSISPLDIHLRFQSPIVWATLNPCTRVDSKGRWQYLVNFHKDFVLQDIGFQKIKDPFVTYQEIDSFISGVMGTNQKPLIEISDKNRLESHGFDKTSFRKSKG